jgi:pimeloyl-ACP methyl ester carboxylesterase
MRWLRRILVFLALWRLLGPVIPPRWRAKQEHPWRIEARTVFVDDREMSVREVGPAHYPAIVMIHGLAGSSMAEWYKVAPILAEGFRILMIDHRSHGLSLPERGRFEIEDEADDVAAIIRKFELDAVGVVGYSMGGAIAQALAYRHPELVTRLALVATMSHHPPLWKLARALGTVLARGWERLTGTGTPEVRAGYLLAVGAVRPEHGRWLWEETHRRDPDAGAAASFALLRFDSRPHLGRIRVPTLVVIPTRDQLVPVGWQHDLASRIMTATSLEIDGGRHELPWSHAIELAGALGRFFAQKASDGLAGEVAPGQEADPDDGEDQ